MTRIGIVAEQAGESRVAASPVTVQKIVALGYEVVVEAGAGAASSFPDAAYVDAGAAVVDAVAAWGSDVVLKIAAPQDAEIALLRPGATLVALLSPALRPELLGALAQRGVTALALDAVPRISRAQSMDVLSSMANIAGYRAVVEAAHEFGRFFTGQVTAAGKVPPAKVLVAGAGVAGLAAIGAASSLGAIVRATDPRPEVADQVKSIGGTYLEVVVPDEQKEVSADGYAKATSAAYDAAAAQLYSDQAADVDIIVTTALIPGRAAPRLVTAADVARMKPGSVVVDMAAAQGGNVEGSVAGERVVTANGVVILGYTDLAGRLPQQASQLYGTNLLNLLTLLTPGKDGHLVLDHDDVVQRAVTVTQDGEITWPPPPVQVSAAPAAKPAAEPVPATPRKRMSAQGRREVGDHRRRDRRALRRVRDRARAPAAAHPRADTVGRHRLLRHRQGRPRPAHAAHERDQRHQRHHRRRRDEPDRGPRPPRAGARGHRGAAGIHQHLRRLRRHPANARHVPEG